jgi:predicted XRE-type DNA-binding protein
MTFSVTAKRWEHGWELHIDGVGVTQCESLKDAENMVREYLDLDGLDATAALRFDYQVGDNLDSEIANTRLAVSEAAEQQMKAAKRQRQLAAKLKRRGLKGREVATLLGISEQRVSQLLKT